MRTSVKIKNAIAGILLLVGFTLLLICGGGASEEATDMIALIKSACVGIATAFSGYKLYLW